MYLKYCIFFCILRLYNFISVDYLFTIESISTFHRFARDRFGPFYIVTKSLSQCKSSEIVDVENEFETDVYVTKISRTQEVYKGYIVIPHDVQVVEMVTKFGLTNGRSKITLFEKRNTSPCSVVYFQTMAAYFASLDPETCTMKKNNYSIQNQNIVDNDKLVHLVTGVNFIYDIVDFKVELFSKNGSVLCMEYICESKPLEVKKMKRKQWTNKTIHTRND